MGICDNKLIVKKQNVWFYLKHIAKNKVESKRRINVSSSHLLKSSFTEVNVRLLE